MPFCLITDVFMSSIFLWAHEFRFQCFIYSCSILPQFVENENGSLVVKQIILFVVNHDRMQGYLSDIKVCNLQFLLRATAVVLTMTLQMTVSHFFVSLLSWKLLWNTLNMTNKQTGLNNNILDYTVIFHMPIFFHYFQLSSFAFSFHCNFFFKTNSTFSHKQVWAVRE